MQHFNDVGLLIESKKRKGILFCLRNQKAELLDQAKIEYFHILGRTRTSIGRCSDCEWNRVGTGHHNSIQSTRSTMPMVTRTLKGTRMAAISECINTGTPFDWVQINLVQREHLQVTGVLFIHELHIDRRVHMHFEEQHGKPINKSVRLCLTLTV